MGQLYNGVGQLYNGVGQLYNGVGQLYNGVGQLTYRDSKTVKLCSQERGGGIFVNGRLRVPKIDPRTQMVRGICIVYRKVSLCE